MKKFSWVQLLLSFLLGCAVSAAIVAYSVFVQMSFDVAHALSSAVYNYEIASQASSKQEIEKQLNAGISCALQGYEKIKGSYADFGVFESYSHIIDKAYKMKNVPCDYVKE
jgi:hypothetical protein